MSQKRKIIGIGFHKTGTTTLGKALEILGYNVKGVTPRMILPIVRGNIGKALKYAEKYDALQDVPWCILYRELDEYFPGSKFILTIRDEESWYKSALRQFGGYIRPQNEWIYGRRKGLFKDKKHAINRYRQHNTDIKKYFKNRPDDLLILNLAEKNNWEKLCAFIGEKIPKTEFPHSNKSSEKKNENGFKDKFKKLRRVVKNTLKITYLDLTGSWK